MEKLSVAEQMLYSTVKIVSKQSGKIRSTGTGFFATFAVRGKSSVPAIVTNRHVVHGGDTITVICHLSDDDKPSGNFAECTLSTRHNNIVCHPNSSIDLCAIPIAPILAEAVEKKTPLFCVTLGLELIPSDDDWNYFDAIEEVTMVGCPNGISDEVNNLPIVRRGITATSLGKLYNGKPEFMVDMACFPGSSGSPIFLHDRSGYLDRRKNSYMVGSSRTRLVGILYAGPQITSRGELILAKPS
ncbi:MAG: trypsin-like peptidase domain-containing protein, partial [Hyphomicrobium sp.]|nr:trypsin-like peptidase domain-containing protein [Hyphomicrobium sp.]